MIELTQITNDLALARRCDVLPGLRVMVDLERLGKAERQVGRNTFISTHTLEDIGRVAAALHRTPLLVRLDPWGPHSPSQIEDALAQGAQQVMLPMFTCADALRDCCTAVDGRVPVAALLETAGALETLEAWVDQAGLDEVFVGLNDLHLSLGQRFMFEPLADGTVARVAARVHAAGRRFGFGGIARMADGELPGRDVLAEHLRLGSEGVILSRTFDRAGVDDGLGFEDAVAQLRQAESSLRQRPWSAVQADAERAARRISDIVERRAAASGMAA